MLANAVKIMKVEWVIDRMSRSLRLISINVPSETWIYVNYIDVELWFKWDYACCLNVWMRIPKILIELYLFIYLHILSVCAFLSGYFWHITDLHLDTAYSTTGDVMKSEYTMEFNIKCLNAIVPYTIDISTSTLLFHKTTFMEESLLRNSWDQIIACRAKQNRTA